MKPTQNTIIHVLLGAGFLAAIALLYQLLQPSQRDRSPLEWVIFGCVALGLVAAVFAPSLVRRWRHQPPPPPLSASDIRRLVMVTLVGCALAVFGVASGMWWLTILGIMLAPLYFMPRGPRQRQSGRQS